jgi:hypothetical protein
MSRGNGCIRSDDNVLLPQAQGFGIFFLAEPEDPLPSMILSSIKAYSKEISTGVRQSWQESIHFKLAPGDTHGPHVRIP